MKPLISVAELCTLQNSSELVVVDCRHQLADPTWGRKMYGAGHVPGAMFLHLDEDMSGPLYGNNGRHPLPDPYRLAAKLSAAGIHRDSRIVVYDDAAGVPAAARLWWLLGWLGHEQVQVLNGGYSAWTAAGVPVSTHMPATAMSCQFDVKLQAQWVAGVDEVLANLNTQKFLLVDARSAARYRGIGETLDPVGGHIPGAANRFFQHNLDAQGLFKSAEMLQQEWAEVLGGLAGGKNNPPMWFRRDCLPQPAGSGRRRIAGRATLCRFLERMVRGSGSPGCV